jgi:hypothetical protein
MTILQLLSASQSSSEYVYSTSMLGVSPTYTVSDTININDYNITWPLDNSIDPDKIERMCKEYPALEKTWRNFKATYDLVLQDWKGNHDDDAKCNSNTIGILPGSILQKMTTLNSGGN